MILLILFLLLFQGNASAGQDLFAILNEDGTVRILNYVPGSNDTLSDVVRDIGAEGRPIIRVTPADLPAEADREFWTFNDVPIGPKLKIDESKKAQKALEKQAKETAKTNLVKKMGLTEQEYEEAKTLGLFS